ncbi:hypothetical protein GCK32_010124 [Trichostrongylus colubriformis]|uniref:Uncharacterized protein n=1 Tax=Trichostrongylus colubriformis TaxID=6319 RepID=A0AAN8G236_TRICO
MTLVGHSTFGSGLPDSPKLASHTPTIREGKRACDMDDDDAPRAKRRFEKINAKLEKFSISGDDECDRRPDMDTSESGGDDDDDDDAWLDSDEFIDEGTSQTIVEEPEEEPNEFLLNECLQRYIDHMKETNGNELVVWRPLPRVQDPFDDPTMKGRIQEVDHADNTCEGSTSEFIEEGGDSESEADDMVAHFDSPQPYKSQIEELPEQYDDCMEMECD